MKRKNPFDLNKSVTIVLFIAIWVAIRFPSAFAQKTNSYETLHELFFEWRKFENPPLLNGAPDYTKSQFRKRQNGFRRIEKILSNITIDPSGFYNTNINIPVVTGTTTYTFLIIADTASDTVHAQRNEIRNSDGSINENASTGSDSAVLSRTITQITNTTVTFKGISHASSGTYSSVGSDAIEVPVTGSNTPINFTISVTLGSSDFVKVVSFLFDNYRFIL